MATIGTAKKMGTVDKIFKSLTAVDLITVVVFAALFRILFMIYKLAEIIFPWNHPAWYFFFQGEIPLWWIGAATIPLIPEAYMYYRSKQLGSAKAAFTNPKDLYIVGLIYTLLAYITNIVLIIFALGNPMPRILVWPVGVLALIVCVVGTWLGIKIGKRISGLIG